MNHFDRLDFRQITGPRAIKVCDAHDYRKSMVPGAYYIGDPVMLFPQDAWNIITEAVWKEGNEDGAWVYLDAARPGAQLHDEEVPSFMIRFPDIHKEGRSVFGTFQDNYNRHYGVDGIIGIIPLETILAYGKADNYLSFVRSTDKRRCGYYFHFDTPVLITADREMGLLHIDNFTIDFSRYANYEEIPSYSHWV